MSNLGQTRERILKMNVATTVDLSKSIKTVLRGIPRNVSNFTLSLTDNSGTDPEDYVQEVNKDVNSVKGFEIFYIQESAAFPGQYDVYVRRERARTVITNA